ncbi:MAG TPA: hypothetical protein VHZ03_58115 [Trebonia sp.]|jgi:hypothetical protein|nr:hypothetical protein [Trebonia sp.]
MSLHYEWTLSLRFRRDVPETFLEDLRSAFAIGTGFALDGDGSELPGGPVTSLVRQQLSADTWLWGLYVRMMVLDDVTKVPAQKSLVLRPYSSPVAAACADTWAVDL